MRNEIRICAFFAFIFILAGCAHPGAVTEEMTTIRQQAYLQWQAAKDGQQDAAIVMDGALSLDQAIRTTLARNRSLQAVLEERNVAKGRVLESYEGVLPNVTISAGYTKQDTATVAYEGVTYPVGQENNYKASVSVVQPLYSGAAFAAMRAARFYNALADEQVKLAVQKAIFDTIQSYYMVLLARAQLDVTQIYAELAESHLRDVQTKRKYGTASDFNVLRSQVELSNARSEMIRFSNQLNMARTQLLKTIGVSQESRVDLTGELVYEPLTVEEEETIRQALLNRPDLAAAILGKKLQEEALKASKSEYLPTVSAFYNYTYGKPDPYIGRYKDEWDDAWNAGVQVTMPIFKGLGRKGRVLQNEATLKKRRIEVLDTRENALFEVRNAILSLQDARELVETQQLSIVQAKEGLRIAEVGYREGSLDQVSVLEARAALTQAQLIHYQSLYSHTIARANLERVKGTLESTVRQQEVP
jgi:outer membrane protein TolC